MNKFRIYSEPPSNINETNAQPSPARLSMDELRICFPTRIVFLSDDVECLVVDNAPVFGVMIDLSESLLRLKNGEVRVEAIDFYGEYKLSFRSTSEFIECQNEFANGRCQAPHDLFRTQSKIWCDYSLAELEERFVALRSNSDYQRLKDYIGLTWRKQGLP